MNKRYWLKGGILAVVINLVLFGFMYGCDSFIPIAGEGFGCGVLFGLPLLPILMFLGYLTSGNVSFSVGLITAFVFWFLIGAILGWLYGKIKNKKV
ncbi:MAG TPA: hypothetical protein VJH55_02315 [Candidatus Paceibacterota bacterium]